MKLFEYIKNLFKRLLSRIIKKRKEEASEIVLSKDIEDKFDGKQKKVIAECLQLGLDISKVAKKKYSAQQMLIIMYGMLMGLDTSPYESFVMTPLEMEYHLYQEAIDKYLGKNYLLRLLNQTNGTMLDDFIKRKIDKDLQESLSAAFEMAPTLLEEHKEFEERTEEDDFYDVLVQMCKDRGLDYNRINKGTIPMMTYDYERLEKELAKVLDGRSAPLKKMNDYKLEPSLLSVLKNKEIEDRVEPVSFYLKGKHITDYYRVYDGIHVYLYRKSFITIKIR